MDWVATGINHGRHVQREQPEIVRRFFAEAGVEASAGALEVAREMVAAVSGIDPASLLPALKRWHKHVYAGEEPEFYGQAVERVALFADFAAWIPWGNESFTQETQTYGRLHRSCAHSLKRRCRAR